MAAERAAKQPVVGSSAAGGLVPAASMLLADRAPPKTFGFVPDPFPPVRWSTAAIAAREMSIFAAYRRDAGCFCSPLSSGFGKKSRSRRTGEKEDYRDAAPTFFLLSSLHLLLSSARFR